MERGLLDGWLIAAYEIIAIYAAYSLVQLKRMTTSTPLCCHVELITVTIFLKYRYTMKSSATTAVKTMHFLS